MAIADEAEVVWGRKVSWGVTCGEHDEFFTTLSTPVMTRLRMEERNVLDTLIDAGVARSRSSEALAWCVRLVGHHEADWIARLHEAVATIEEARRSGPLGPSSRPHRRTDRAREPRGPAVNDRGVAEHLEAAGNASRGRGAGRRQAHARRRRPWRGPAPR